MNIIRIKELQKTLDNENISYNEIVEIDSLAEQAGIEAPEEMMAADILIELERIYSMQSKTIQVKSISRAYKVTVRVV